MRDHAARRRGRVSIALLPSLAAGWLPPRLATFRQQNPGIELDVADVLSDACIERVRSGRADFALASSRTASVELRTEDFCTDRFHLVCRHDHPLLQTAQPIGVAELARWPIVQLARSSSVRQYVEAAFFPTQLNTVMELDQLSTVAGMVRAGLGLTIVPSLTLFHFDHPELAERVLDVPRLVRQVFVIRLRDRSLSCAAQGLYDALLASRPG